MKAKGTELRSLAWAAKKKGFKVSSGTNGGGWIRLAVSCGLENCKDKTKAKSYLRGMFGGHGEVTITRPKTESVSVVSYKSNVNTDEFLRSYEWRRVRMQVLKKHGARCQCCGATPQDGVRIHVDHIKPRRLFPQLALDENNLQVLCEECNHGKGNWDTTDWRKEDEVLSEEQLSHLKSITE